MKAVLHVSVPLHSSTTAFNHEDFDFSFLLALGKQAPHPFACSQKYWWREHAVDFDEHLNWKEGRSESLAIKILPVIEIVHNIPWTNRKICSNSIRSLLLAKNNSIKHPVSIFQCINATPFLCFIHTTYVLCQPFQTSIKHLCLASVRLQAPQASKSSGRALNDVIISNKETQFDAWIL